LATPDNVAHLFATDDANEASPLSHLFGA
jgi:hypothetical protein